MIHVLFVLLFLWLCLSIIRNKKSSSSFGLFLFSGLRQFLKFACIAYSLFYIFWGFNYKASSIETRLSLASIEPDSIELKKELHLITNQLIELRSSISASDSALTSTYYSLETEDIIRKSLESLLHEWDIPIHGKVRVRTLKPKGVLLRISTAGVYMPYAFEGHIDAGLHPIQWPFTMAHEMTHGYGITDEGACNFIGLLACMNTDDLFIRYSGLLAYWRYLNRNYRTISSNGQREFIKTVKASIIADLKDIYRNGDLYPDFMPKIRDMLYDQYLKSNGISSGLSSYSKIVALNLAWKESDWNRALYSKWYPN